MSRTRKERLYGIVHTMRQELVVAEAEIAALDDYHPNTDVLMAADIDEDLESMRSRLGALELRVQAIEGVT